MSLVLRIESGSRAGDEIGFTKPVVLTGRHPEADLRFDATIDIDVSTRHAEFRGGHTGWSVFDLASTNGTWVNGTRISAPTPIRAGDAISFGVNGPRVAVVSTGAVADAAPPATVLRKSTVGAGKTEARIAAAVAAQTAPLRKLVGVLVAVVVVGVGALVWLNKRTTSEFNELLRQSDSLRSALEVRVNDASTRAAGFDSIVRALKRERDALTRALQSGGGDAALLRSQIGALDRRTNQALSLSNREILAANGKAVVYIIVEDQDKQPYSGTAFGITSSGLIVTNKHVLLDDRGRPPNRIAVYYADTDTPIPAKFVGVADNADIGFVQVEQPGTYPTVRGIGRAQSLGVGDPIVVTGFPFGTNTPQQGTTKKTTTTYGAVSKILSDTLQINAFAAQGSSGSPVFDSRGLVIGVLSAGHGATSSVLAYCVPSSSLIAALPAEARGIVRD